MNFQLLAAIDHRRHITHDSGQIVRIHWENHRFSLDHAAFIRLVRALESGLTRHYVGGVTCCVVRVDDDLREVWIGKTCLALNRQDYRALLNAAWRTETRLLGVRKVSQQERPAENAIAYRPPASISFSLN